MQTQCLYDNGNDYKVQSIWDGAVYDLVGEDCIKAGTYNEFNESHTSTSLQMQIASGFGFIGGGFFALPNAVQIELQASTSNLYVVARIDKTRTDGEKAQVEVKTEVQLKFENLNGSGNIRDLLLYKVSTNASGITEVVDLRKIKSGHTFYMQSLAISGTPQALIETMEWDVDGTWTHYLDVDVIGVYETDYISNIVLKTDFECGPVITTLQNKIRFYFSSNSAVNTTAYDITLIGR